MRLSAYFLPLLKENPSEAQIVSHRLMLRAGMIRQSSAGIYTWLPLGFRVLKKVEQIVREEQDARRRPGMLMPTIQPAELWRESGRYEDYGKEMLRILDRHERDMLYGPTNEELITDIFRNTVKSYRDLPKNLYHIQWKFRDEVRPRFGVMRGREFLMKDAYSFDLDKPGAIALLLQDVRRLPADLQAHGAEADPDARRDRPDRRRSQPRVPSSWPIPARASLFFDSDVQRISTKPASTTASPEVQSYHRTSSYAATDEKHDPADFEARVPEARRSQGARHRGRPDLLFRHQIFEAAGRHRRRPRRRAGAGRDGLLRHRRLAPRRRHHRGEP